MHHSLLWHYWTSAVTLSPLRSEAEKAVIDTTSKYLPRAMDTLKWNIIVPGSHRACIQLEARPLTSCWNSALSVQTHSLHFPHDLGSSFMTRHFPPHCQHRKPAQAGALGAEDTEP